MAKAKKINNVVPLHNGEQSNLLSPTKAEEALQNMSVDRRRKHCKVRGQDVIEYKIPLDKVYQDKWSQVRKHDCDLQGVAQIANEIALEDQERGLCVRVYRSSNETRCATTWGNTGFRGLKKINKSPDNFLIEEYDLGFVWVNNFDKPFADIKQWQHKENNSHSYNKNASEDDNLDGLMEAISSGKLDTPTEKFKHLSDEDKRTKAREYVKQWLTKSLPSFTSLWNKVKKTDQNLFKTKSYTTDEIKTEMSKLNAFGMTGVDDTWSKCETKSKKIGGVFKENNQLVKVSVVSSTYATKGAALQHAFQALYVDKVATYSTFVISVEGCNTKQELDAKRQDMIDDFKEWNASLPGNMKFVHEVRFLNQCTYTETTSPSTYARVEKL